MTRGSKDNFSELNRLILICELGKAAHQLSIMPDLRVAKHVQKNRTSRKHLMFDQTIVPNLVKISLQTNKSVMIMTAIKVFLLLFASIRLYSELFNSNRLIFSIHTNKNGTHEEFLHANN